MEIREKLSRKITIIIGLLIAGIVGFRAVYLSFTIDESITYSILQGDLTYLMTANHHILNTFLMKISGGLFGESELALRLPNVILCLVYVLFVYRFLRLEKSGWAALLGVTILLLNPFLIDFFSLARGYGLSVGFMMGSLYYLLRKNLAEQNFAFYMNDVILTIVFAILALFSNLSTINFFIAVLLILIVQYILLHRRLSFNIKNHLQFSAVVILALIALYLAMDRLLMLNEAKQLYFGVDSLSDMLATLYVNVLYHFNNFTILSIFIGIVFVLAALVIAVTKKFDSQLFKLYIILVLLISATVTQHYFFDAKYPAERTAIYFVPVFGVFVYRLFSELYQLSNNKPSRWLVRSGLVTIILMTVINFSQWSRTSFTNTSVWKFDMHTKEVAIKIGALGYEECRTESFTLSNHWLFQPTLNYYIHSLDLPIEPALHDPDTNTHFVYNYIDKFDGDGYEVVLTFDDIGTSLFRKIID